MCRHLHGLGVIAREAAAEERDGEVDARVCSKLVFKSASLRGGGKREAKELNGAVVPESLEVCRPRASQYSLRPR